MFIVSLTYRCDLSEIERHLPAHIAYLDKYYAAGVFLASGRKVPRDGGVILATAPNRAALLTILAEDPFQRHLLADYQITEFVPRGC
ncbi:YciI family protein [Shewanella sp.]|uniref:YciI family protein n=1 Tax=Shewanella sp. TaxID=50422 RepID=UPI003A97A9C2